MKKFSIIILIMAIALVCIGTAIAEENNQKGPAPNSGDGVSDGSGMDPRTGPNSEGPGGSDNGPRGART